MVVCLCVCIEVEMVVCLCVCVEVEMVYSLLSMLGTHDKDDMSQTLLAMSSSADSCVAMRQSGTLSQLVPPHTTVH